MMERRNDGGCRDVGGGQDAEAETENRRKRGGVEVRNNSSKKDEDE